MRNTSFNNATTIPTKTTPPNSAASYGPMGAIFIQTITKVFQKTRGKMDKKKINKSEDHGSPIFRDSEYSGNGNEKQETIKEIFKSILQTKNVQMRRFK